jgi:AcrR family transcriptional regulator
MRAGRPRQFDMDEALDQALHVFWEKGYEGASMPDLTKAMGINRPSIYAAFGNKEELFRAALDRYTEKASLCMQEQLNEKTARASFERFMQGVVENSVNPKHPRGCLLVQGALACGEEAEPIRKELAARRGNMEIHLRKRLERGKKEGDFPKNADAGALARFFSTLIQGIAVQTSGGATRKELEAVVETAFAAWPV